MLKSIRQLLTGTQSEILPDYLKWREVIFSVASNQVGISSRQKDVVYGVVMDVGLVDDKGKLTNNNYVFTSTAFASGEASIRTSFGGGVIGLGGNDEVVKFSKQIVELAQSLLTRTGRINKYNLPESGKIFYYFLTTSGLRLHISEEFSKEDPFNEIYSRFYVIRNIGEGFMRESKQ